MQIYDLHIMLKSKAVKSLIITPVGTAGSFTFLLSSVPAGESDPRFNRTLRDLSGTPREFPSLDDVYALIAALPLPRPAAFPIFLRAPLPVEPDNANR